MKTAKKSLIFTFVIGIITAGIIPAFWSTTVYAASRTRPIAYTEAAGGITPTSAVLHARINPGGVETMYWFEYGVTALMGSRTDILSAGLSNSHVDFARRITGLIPNTLYYYRVVAQNGYGRSEGVVLTLATNLQGVSVSGINANAGNGVFMENSPAPIVQEQNSTPATITGTHRAQECILIAPTAVPQEAGVGDEINYALTYRNGCAYDIQNANIKIILPAGFTITSQSSLEGVYTQDAYGIQYLIGAVPAGMQESVTIRGNIGSVLKKGEVLLFHSLFSYTDEKGIPRASDAYTVVPITANEAFTASVFDAFKGLFQSGWFTGLLLIIVAFLGYRVFFKRRKKGEDEVDVLKA